MPYFFGIKTPLSNIDIVDKINNIITTLPVEPIPRELIHITILYVGKYKIPNEVIEKIEKDLINIGYVKFKITDIVDIYPNMSKPRAIVLKVEDIQNRLSKVRGIIMSRLREFKIPIEDKYIHTFSPHITIGRIRSKIDMLQVRDIVEIVSESVRGYSKIVDVDFIELIDSSDGLYRTMRKIFLNPQKQDLDTL